MDPVRTANLHAYVANAPKSGSAAAYEKKQLAEARRQRATMTLMQRMEADAEHKQALEHVMDMRQNVNTRVALDRMVERMRPDEPLKEPKVVSHNNKAVSHGHDRKMNWAPLECY
eukprot:TRINITY_DN106217_c0_g1_i1.p1 TRINITY_DN106217_c0_g1~~TRINITY_DN106217_c0_g1_i1.p1  ORF type:complete len:115 (+),score=30.65 TRINITY_DN106217_c0_g1_i1:64-408(+)